MVNFIKKMKPRVRIVFLTSPFLSCHGLGLTRSSVSGGMGGLSSSLTVDEDEESDGGTGELEGHSAGRIMLAGIRAPTTASLGNTQHVLSTVIPTDDKHQRQSADSII